MAAALQTTVLELLSSFDPFTQAQTNQTQEAYHYIEPSSTVSYVFENVEQLKQKMLIGIEARKMTGNGGYMDCVLYMDEGFQSVMCGDGESVEVYAFDTISELGEGSSNRRFFLSNDVGVFEFECLQGIDFDSFLEMLATMIERTKQNNLTSPDKQLQRFAEFLSRGMSVMKKKPGGGGDFRSAVLYLSDKHICCQGKRANSKLMKMYMKNLKVFSNPFDRTVFFFTRKGSTQTLLEVKLSLPKFRDYTVCMLDAMLKKENYPLQTSTLFLLSPQRINSSHAAIAESLGCVITIDTSTENKGSRGAAVAAAAAAGAVAAEQRPAVNAVEVYAPSRQALVVRFIPPPER